MINFRSPMDQAYTNYSMQRCVIYTYGLIIILISYTHCSDKPNAKPTDNADENASSNIYDIIDFIQDQPTTQDGKYYLIEPQPGKDGKYRLVPITHLEYIPAHPEPQPEPKDTELQYPGPYQHQLESLLTEDQTTETTKPNEPKHPHHSYKHNRPTPRHGKITEPELELKPEPELEPEHMKPIYHKPGYYEQADTIRKKSEHTKICKQITFIKKDEMGNFVEMDNHDFDIDYEVKATIKYSFKTNLEIIYCDGEIVYTHDIGMEYALSLKYSKFMGRFIIQLRKDFLFIRYLDDKWLVKTKKIPDYIKIFTQDDQGNYIELTPEHCNIDITSTGSFKYNVDSLKCTRIEYYNELVWDKRIKRGYPMTICYSLKISFMIYFKGYVCFYERINGMFYLKHIRSNKTKGYLDK
ncbi:Theileria-specific sub-telomeric protein, SVSP family [Theileria annulata]|uniref:Conserved Theileria-specific sub-telomeric protein, SVSP family, putative n=1 Tax=Theileria annulata TaxID=5874 RepID=Q4UD62_THEAN|nr:Theileria-specific sub-telomeric protein, SVSP family [Theileria annulata]CAI74977.1 conserved Theileria-specific sub-telomeric protein, SVSP family, putative [Theileria annulata]|eukprot:XP_954712.1 conserved Theileria-specific sub-telomeric protein, SVSP family, putative [Theileria annulata]